MDEFSEEIITISTPGIVTSFIFELSLPIILSFIWVKNFNYYKFKIIITLKILLLIIKELMEE